MPSVVGVPGRLRCLPASSPKSQAPISTVCLPEKLIKHKGEASASLLQPLSPVSINFFYKKSDITDVRRPGPQYPFTLGAMVLRISASLVRALWEHSEKEHPIEACGVIAGLAANRAPTRHIPMENSAYSPTFYEFESKALLALYRELDDRDEVPVVIYHSHTSTEAYPSRTDIAYAGEPEAHYVLLSTREEIASRSEFRSFRIVDGVVTEEPVEIIGD